MPVIATRYRLQIQGNEYPTQMINMEFDSLAQIKQFLKKTTFVQYINLRVYKLELNVDNTTHNATITSTELNW